MAEDTKRRLIEDVRSIPSWVWFGGAAAVGLLFILHRSSSPAAAPAAAGANVTGGVSSVGTPVAGSDVYGVSTAIDNLSTIDQAILSQLTHGSGGAGTSLPTTGTTPVATTTPVVGATSGTLVTGTAGGQTVHVLNPANGGGPLYSTGGAWMPFWKAPDSLTSTFRPVAPPVPYTGPGTYNGVALP